jgi:type II secretory pathway pseudopilin PulG
MSKRLKSFTLSEMLVVLIITAIVVGLAFSVLTLVRKQVFNLQSNTDQKINQDLLQSKLFIDFNTYTEAFVEESNKLKFKNEVDSVFYIFEENLIKLDRDTLCRNLNQVQFLYKNNNVKQGRVDAVKYSVETKQGVFTNYFIYKSNDALEINEISLNGL